MRKMIRKFEKQGLYRKVNGRIEVRLNDRTEVVNVTHAVTHDEHQKTVFYHVIESFIDNKSYHKVELPACDLMQLSVFGVQFIDAVRYEEDNLTAAMQKLADTLEPPTPEDQLNSMGYL